MLAWNEFSRSLVLSILTLAAVGCAPAPLEIRAEDLATVTGLGKDGSAYLRTRRGEQTVTGATRVALHLETGPDVPLQISLRDLEIDRSGALWLPPYDSSSRLPIDEIERAEIVPDHSSSTVGLAIGIVGTALVAVALFALLGAAASAGGG